MKFEFIPLDYAYFDFNGKNYAKVYGRSKEGKRVCLVDDCDIYFWAILKEGVSEKEVKKLCDKIEKVEFELKSELRKTRVLKTEVHAKNFLGKEVKAVKIFIDNLKDAHDIADKLDFPEIEKRREYDINFTTRYIIEKKLIPCRWAEIEGKVLGNNELGGIASTLNVDLVVRVDKISTLDEKKQTLFEPKIAGYDIEVDEFEVGKGKILMVSLVSDNFKKVITWKKAGKDSAKKIDYVEYVKDERALLESFAEHLKKLSPDLLVGYFSDKFDLPYIKMRAQKNNVELNIGLDASQIRFTGGRNKLAKIEGISHIDIHRFIEVNYSQYLQSETLSLNEVSSELLGEKKEDFKIKHSSRLKEDEWVNYFSYNLQDSVLVFKLAQKIWPDLSEFSRIMHKPLFEVSRDSMSVHVEDYIIHNLEKFNEVIEKRPINEEIETRIGRDAYEGAFVLQPSPGLYENVVVFDFTSYWPSIIATFNLSRSTFIGDNEKKQKDSVVVDVGNGKEHYFTKKPGFFPLMLKEIIEKRKKYKEEYKKNPDPITKARSNAYKLIANAAYGYQGFFGARYYCPEASAAATAISRKFIKETIEKIKKEGYGVIYGDTDAVMFTLNKKTKEHALSFLKKLNSELPGIMELDLEDFYKRGLWVTTRGGEIGAKKKYALINNENKLKIRGFETVRRDWCMLARNLQNEVLRKILNDGNEKNALSYTKEIIKKLKERKIERKDIIIKTQLKKQISEYKAIGPHVIAAKRMIELKLPVDSGSLIEYYISQPKLNNKGKPLSKNIRDRVALPDEEKDYDVDYYLNNQVLPAVENIFQVFNLNIKGIIDGESQKKLF